MRKIFGLSLLMALLLSFGLMASLPITSYAIGEVTPTPSPEEDEPDEDINVEELINEAITNLQDGDFSDAVDNMNLVLELEPENTTALLIRGIGYAQLAEF